MAEITVVHLVWAPLGPEPLRRFLASLQAHPAGVDHELLVVLNGFGAAVTPEVDDALTAVDHRRLLLDGAVQDLVAYRAALDATDRRIVCFMNSYAVALHDGWLERLTAPLADPGIGLVGASGSWESAFSSAPAKLRLARVGRFPRFPNPALRTNAFAGRRAELLDLDWGRLDGKLDALRLESGRRSLTRQVARRGLRTVVAGADRDLYDPEDWERSATFRAGGQRNLLVADNRTEDYARADAAERLRLARMAWGRSAAGD